MNSIEKPSLFDSLLRRFLLVVVTIFSVIGTLGIIGMFMAGVMLGILSEVTGEITDSSTVLYGDESATTTVYSLPITGVIVGDQTDISDPWGLVSNQVTYGYDIKHQLIELASNDDVKAVILDINSPGGTIYGAKAIADGVAEFRERSQKPIVAYVSGLAASGGYWAAVATDRIMADVGTGIGSIGVISGPYQYFDQVVGLDGGAFVGGVVTENGIENTYITAGESKDLGNPFRKLTTKELQSLQLMVDKEYDRFVAYVSLRRSLEQSTITDTIGALVYDPDTAQDLNLIDTVGSREDLYQDLADQLSVRATDLKVVREEADPGILGLFLRSRMIESNASQTVFCGITKTQLVYHGDVTQFCR